MSLCKALPLPNPEGEEAPPPDSEKEHWANFIADYNELRYMYMVLCTGALLIYPEIILYEILAAS